MDPTFWIIIGCFVWMVIGVFVLGNAAERRKSDELFFFPDCGIDILSLAYFVLCLLGWPLVLLLANYFDRSVKILTPQPATHRLHQAKLTAGAEGITLTDLQPTGKIEVAGVTHDAQVQHGFLEAGVKVVVCGTYMNHTVVKRAD